VAASRRGRGATNDLIRLRPAHRWTGGDREGRLVPGVGGSSPNTSAVSVAWDSQADPMVLTSVHVRALAPQSAAPPGVTELPKSVSTRWKGSGSTATLPENG
jgi:hypothetical protein